MIDTITAYACVGSVGVGMIVWAVLEWIREDNDDQRM